jgi:hypothetical protein
MNVKERSSREALSNGNSDAKKNKILFQVGVKGRACRLVHGNSAPGPFAVALHVGKRPNPGEGLVLGTREFPPRGGRSSDLDDLGHGFGRWGDYFFFRFFFWRKKKKNVKCRSFLPAIPIPAPHSIIT